LVRGERDRRWHDGERSQPGDVRADRPPCSSHVADEEVSMSPSKDRKAAVRSTAAKGKKSSGFTEAERAAMKERARELKAEARAGRDRAAGERDVLEKIAEMPESDRAIAERVHAIVADSAPDLVPKTWYGMPAYARDGKVVCYFQSADKFKSRYATFGFNDDAKLDEGTMWPTSFAVKKLTAADEKRIASLVRQAVS
jgi:uncharacterized protein YdhG (YjbR/CyaY superfamily)